MINGNIIFNYAKIYSAVEITPRPPHSQKDSQNIKGDKKTCATFFFKLFSNLLHII